MRDILIVHYDEIALKGGNRTWFEDTLGHVIQNLFRGEGGVALNKLYGRFVLAPGRSGLSREQVVERVRRLPGVQSILFGVETDVDEAALLEAVDHVLPREGEVASFGVRVKRADKRYPIRSVDLERLIGSHVQGQRSWSVDLGSPDLWVRIEIVNRRALVATRRVFGPGGLPTGVAGRGVAMLSGGIDSPVAAWMMMHRGVQVACLHFHSAPFTGKASQEKVTDLAQHLTRFQATVPLAMVPFAEPIQQEVIQKAPQRYRVILYRRFMMRIANEAARASRAKCIITGEALGQVASQTIENLTTVEDAATFTVLRPLVGLGKASIIEKAQQIGTFETSIQPHDDCCGYLMPRRPATRTTVEELEEVEQVFDIPALVHETWERREERRLRFEDTVERAR